MRTAWAIVVLLLAPGAGAAPWLQYGSDAARTGASADAGPETFDVAFHLDLPGRRWQGAPPLLIDREMFVLASDGSTSTLYVVGLDTARAAPLLAHDQGPSTGLASDGERFFVARAADVAAYAREDASLLWATPYPPILADVARRTECVEPAVRDGVVYLACTQSSLVNRSQPEGAPPDVGEQRLGAGMAFALALDAATGRMLWSWDARQGDGKLLGSAGDPPEHGSVASAAMALSIVGDVAAFVVREARDGVVFLPDTVWALDVATGTYRWNVRSATDALSAIEPLVEADTEGVSSRLAQWEPAVPTGTSDITLVKFSGLLRALSTRDGTERWNIALTGGSELGERNGGNAVGYLGTSIIATSFASVYRIDGDTRTIRWVTSFPGPDEDFELFRGLVAAGGHIYVRSWNRVVTVLDAEDGSVVWRYRDDAPRNSVRAGLAVGEGVAVFAPLEGNITVVGRTGASLALDVRAATLYPRVGSRFEVDLSGSAAGAFGAATEFRAEWGDGRVTEWQDSPLLTHVYDDAGPRTAVFHARNAAGQTASRAIALEVGGAPVTFLEDAFSAENQERTFFALGLLVTLAGALFAAWRVRRRRTLLARELVAIDTVYARTKEMPATCEAALAAARARAHTLLVHGRLDEAQVATLLRHADELAARLRVGFIEERFGFLSVHLARRLRAILEDGRVSPFERGQFLDAVEREAALTREQKGEVRQAVEERATRDVGA
ncbi:MAG TPA: PQQ-binding-like beta-propeller repeat protein [Candidatus Thermoplasmatota archaeon]|nr:PQQ-binding-like beta-propeller repeat protein [Candidatus Thermoplasmatota archaeon]